VPVERFAEPPSGLAPPLALKHWLIFVNANIATRPVREYAEGCVGDDKKGYGTDRNSHFLSTSTSPSVSRMPEI
jgi:hypothetical protein